MMTPDGPLPSAAQAHPDDASDRPPAPGQLAMIMAGLAIGLLLMGIQLWLITVALDLYLAGEGRQIWQLGLISGAIFLGGLAILGVLRRRPEVRRVVPSEGGLTALLRARGRRS
jgi:hypothetical protein